MRVKKAPRKFHFLGICGTAMGAVAVALQEREFTVTGSDENVYPPMSTFLQEKGIAPLEGYRAEQLSESAIRQLLGFESRMQVHAFLKEHGVYLHYDLSDLDHDRVTSGRSLAERSGPEPTNEPHLG